MEVDGGLQASWRWVHMISEPSLWAMISNNSNCLDALVVRLLAGWITWRDARLRETAVQSPSVWGCSAWRSYEIQNLFRPLMHPDYNNVADCVMRINAFIVMYAIEFMRYNM